MQTVEFPDLGILQLLEGDRLKFYEKIVDRWAEPIYF